jgi:hypothetical protein
MPAILPRGRRWQQSFGGVRRALARVASSRTDIPIERLFRLHQARVRDVENCRILGSLRPLRTVADRAERDRHASNGGDMPRSRNADPRPSSNGEQWLSPVYGRSHATRRGCQREAFPLMVIRSDATVAVRYPSATADDEWNRGDEMPYCRKCSGTGRCKACGGKREIPRPAIGTTPRPGEPLSDPCKVCLSSGNCRECRGSGRARAVA